MGRLDDKIVLITGATSGMGEAFAKLFALEGAEIVVVGRNQEKGNMIKDEICCRGGKARYLYCDVSDRKSVQNLRQEYEKYYDHLDVLINNAGILITSVLDEIKEDEWKQVFDTNTHSVMYMTQEFMDMILPCKGNILNNASIDGMQSNTRGRASYAYGASKAAVIQFTQLCALNYTPKGIRVNCLCPGVTETPFFTNRDFSRFIDAIPMGRVAQADEIAKAALFLISDDASYVSGAVLTVDGAASLR